MRAMQITRVTNLNSDQHPLSCAEMDVPTPGANEVLVKVAVCGVCHTELDEIEGRTPPPVFPMVPGHQVVGSVVELGSDVKHLSTGDRVGVAWIHSACGECEYCVTNRENLCPQFKATGRDANGGYAEFMTIPATYAHLIPQTISDLDAAPFLCAGAIGYRSLRLTGICDGDTLGLTGFGGSAHLVLKMVKYKYPTSDVFVFARSPQEREFALDLGAIWAGDNSETPPVQLDAIIDTTPVWGPVVSALSFLKPGGRLVINAIRKEDGDKARLVEVDYARHLWMEKEIKSVANVASGDVQEFLALAAGISLKPTTQMFELGEANQALVDLKQGHVRGAKVLQI